MLAVVIAAGAAVIGWTAPSHLSFRLGDFYNHGSESFKAQSDLAAGVATSSLGSPDLAFIVRDSKPGSQLAGRLEKSSLVAKVRGNVFHTRNGFSFTLVWLKPTTDEKTAAAQLAQRYAGPGVMVGGQPLARQAFADQVDADLRRAQIIAFPFLLLVGLLVFRSLVAAVLPVSVGGIAVLITLGVFRLTTEALPLSVFSIDIALALALGLGVDYSLLMVSRFREGLAAGLAPARGAEEMLETAGRTVAYSSVAIAASFLSLIFVPIPFVRSIAFGGAAIAIITGLTALLLMPALLVLLGHRVNALALRSRRTPTVGTSRPRESGAWYRVARLATRRPVLVALGSGMVLVVLAIPAFSMRFTGIDLTSLPASADARQFAETARTNFKHPLLGELSVAIYGNEEKATRLVEKVDLYAERSSLGIPFPYAFEKHRKIWEVRLNPTQPVFSSGAQRLVSNLRVKSDVSVAGDTAAYLDSAAALRQSLPLTLTVVVLSMFLFVYLATGSLVLPLKMLAMNTLSFGAALGVTVFIFQDGRLAGFLDYTPQDAVFVAIPVIMVAASFGLLTDYGLFLLLRIKEERERGVSDLEGIAIGLERTGPIITAAALLFCIAVGAFSTSGLLLLKIVAVAITLTVALDAFVVRPLLVPSLMAILGKWNWWPREMPTSTPTERTSGLADPSPALSPEGGAGRLDI